MHSLASFLAFSNKDHCSSLTVCLASLQQGGYNCVDSTWFAENRCMVPLSTQLYNQKWDSESGTMGLDKHEPKM